MGVLHIIVDFFSGLFFYPFMLAASFLLLLFSEKNIEKKDRKFVIPALIIFWLGGMYLHYWH